jgi:hypothetical protein
MVHCRDPPQIGSHETTPNRLPSRFAKAQLAAANTKPAALAIRSHRNAPRGVR